MRRVLVTMAVVLAIAVNGSAALAGGPDIDDFEVQAADDMVLWDCGDFEILNSAWVRFSSKSFYDRDGELARVTFHGWWTETFTNSATGMTIEGGENGYNFVEDMSEPGIWIHHGLMFHVTVPGQGRVMIDTGYFVMDVRDWDFVDWRETVTVVRGNHQNIDGDFDKLCAALS